MTYSILFVTSNIFASFINEQFKPRIKYKETITDNIKNTILVMILLTFIKIILVFFISSISFSEDIPSNKPNAVKENPAKTVLMVMKSICLSTISDCNGIVIYSNLILSIAITSKRIEYITIIVILLFFFTIILPPSIYWKYFLKDDNSHYMPLINDLYR